MRQEGDQAQIDTGNGGQPMVKTNVKLETRKQTFRSTESLALTQDVQDCEEYTPS
jgi:hypothetical protein